MRRAAAPDRRPTDPQQLSFVSPDGAALLHLMRENLRLMAQLATRYEVQGLDSAVGGPPAFTVHSPADVVAYLGPELRELAQEQMRAVLLDTKLHVLSTPLISQGGLNATVIRLADCFREAVHTGADSLILVHNHPSGAPRSA